MTPKVQTDMKSQPAPMGEASRLAGVFFEPGKPLKTLRRGPISWYR
jgi:hypothetical protein